MEEHRTECPLEPVACEFAEVGCSVKVARRDLKLHMEESQQQHLLSATLLNLKLTRETIAEKDRLLALKEQKLSQMLAENERQLAEKDRQIADKDEKLAEKDHLIADKDHQLKEKGSIIADKEKQLGELQTELKKFRLEFMEPTKIALDHLLSAIGGKFTFVLYEFSSLQKKGNYGDWFSHPFSIDGYNLKLNVETKVRGPNMKIRLYHAVDSGHQSMTFVATILLLNQVVDHSHYSKQLVIDLPSGPCSRPYNLIAFKELHRKDHTVQYLKDDSLKIHMWIKHKT
ncbi:MAG: hypothetical protein MJE68_16715 [Proteobacteria bacterium]|nr:hypothetical protein [Pseudomonadota bacterium]